jgi:hypothetical protein
MSKKDPQTDISLHTNPVGMTWRGTRFTGDFERKTKDGSGNGASLSMGGLRGVLADPSPGNVKDM